MKETPLKDNVVHSDKGDIVVDNDKLDGAILAALNNIHQRKMELEEKVNGTK